MELSLAADPGVALVAAGAPAALGTDPDDAAAEAFAALLAALVLGHPNVPAPEAPALPAGGAVVDASSTVAVPVAAEVAVPVVPAGTVPEAPVGTIVPAAIALPAVAAAAPGHAAGTEPLVDPDADAEVPTPAAPLTDIPEASRPALTADTPEAPAPGPFSSRPGTQTVHQRDENVVADPAQAGVDVSPAPISSRPGTETVHQRDQNASTAPIAPTTRAPERITPEVVRAAAPTAPPPPVEQVVRAVAPLRQLGDGTHQVVLELRPANLGVVRVELSLDAGVIHLGLRAETAATGELLRAALPELRQQLDGAGLVAGRLAVDPNATGSAGHGQDGQPSWRTDPDGGTHQHPAEADPGSGEEQPHTAYSTSAYGQIDVLL